MTDTPTSTSRSPKPRSPSYPGIDLESAIMRAMQLFDSEGRHAAHVDTVYGAWGIKPGSGGGGVVLAALKKFGLIVDDGRGDTRRARLSDTALTILLGEQDSPERSDAIRRAALLPSIHAEVWEKFDGSLPSDPNLKLWLIREKGFTTSGAGDFIVQLRHTISFAGLGTSDRLIPHETASNSEASPSMSVTPATFSRSGGGRPAPPMPVSHYQSDTQSAGRSIQLPLGVGWATLEAPFPLTEEAWTLMLTVLQAMKPGLVRDPGASDDQPGQ